MASNSFGTIFRITTWGESHGPCIGCCVDGCPAGLALSCDEMNAALAQRRGGRNSYVSARREDDKVELLSGVFEGKTTGAPIAFVIWNRDVDSSKYEALKGLLRPGHANFTYLEKYGIFDWRGGGRASARETVVRVAAGAIAEKLLQSIGVKIVAYVQAIGGIEATAQDDDIMQNPLFCPDREASQKMMKLLDEAKETGDSLGGVVECVAEGVPPGLGDPIYDKLDAKLAYAVMSLPASKAFEIGEGVAASRMRGSTHNDAFIMNEERVSCTSNHAGGLLGGITTGLPIVFRTHFKPTSSIPKQQKTVDLSGSEVTCSLPEGSRHDPTVVIRAVPVVKAMGALVLADSWLYSRCNKLNI
ncbi:MAG: chorismate synthase [Verrucomicrobia bacterium]|nr:chorismate synthase [Verrucomicrobiota bacterium]